MLKKTIAISFTEGRVIRDFFENGFVEILQQVGCRVIFFTPAERVPYFKTEWENKNVSVYPLLPYTPDVREQRAENFRKRLRNKSTRLHHKFLAQYHRFFRTDETLQSILTKEKCDVVLITNPMYRHETLLWSTAKKLGIKTLV